MRPLLVVLDRDGVLNADTGYLHLPDQVRWMRGALAALRLLHEANVPTAVATNQSGIARGLYPESHVSSLHAWMQQQVEIYGGRLGPLYYCPHHPAATIARYRLPCECRKPAPGLLLRAANAAGVRPRDCIFIGDRATDMLAAGRAGMQGVHYDGDDLAALVRPFLA